MLLGLWSPIRVARQGQAVSDGNKENSTVAERMAAIADRSGDHEPGSGEDSRPGADRVKPIDVVKALVFVVVLFAEAYAPSPVRITVLLLIGGGFLLARVSGAGFVGCCDGRAVIRSDRRSVGARFSRRPAC